MSHQPLMPLVALYEAILTALGCSVTDNLVSLETPDGTLPVIMDKRRLVLPSTEILRASRWTDWIAFHPLSESIARGESLVLRQSGLLVAYKDTLVTGVSGRFVGIDPNTGTLRWEVSIASPRGTNDVERLVELIGGVSREGSVLCTRAYQMAVGCIDADAAQLRWTVRAEGINGISGDEEIVAGADANGVITAWKRDGGSVAWTSNRLKYRKLSQPLVLGRSVIFGDGNGTVHMLSKKDGSPLNRFATNSSGISVAPVVAGNTMVVQTNDGAVFGFQPE